MFTRRKFLVHSASTLAVTLGAGRLAKAAVGAWAQQQGGSQDLQTKLVWLDYTLATSLAGNADITSYSYNFTAAANYPVVPGIPVTNPYDDWRVPTLNEILTAYANGLALNCPLYGTPGVHYLWWSSKSRAGGKQAAAVDLNTGVTDWVIVKDSYLAGIFVRQGT